MSQLKTRESLPIDDDALVDERFLSAFLDVSLAKLRNDRYQKRGFKYLKIGSLVRYRTGDLRKEIKELLVETDN